MSAVILPGCLALAPAEDVLTMACAMGRCAQREGLACAEHDRCYGCGRVICACCDTDGGMAVTRFPGDAWSHPHNQT